MIHRPNMMVIVSVKSPESKRRIVVPVPLVVVGAALDIGTFGLWVGKKTGAQWYGKIREKLQDPNTASFLPGLRAMFWELVRVGPMTLVDVVEKGGNQVSVRLV
jgi:hypothetical protein